MSADPGGEAPVRSRESSDPWDRRCRTAPTGLVPRISVKTGNVANDIYIEEEMKNQKAHEEVKAAKEEKIAARQAQIDATTDLLADTEELTSF